MASYWRQKSRAVIEAALAEGRAKGLEGKALERHVSDAYPFGERLNWPYQIWLNEFALLVRGRLKPMSRPKVEHRPGPMPLFGEVE
jgi:hypothetical protein